jgi:hypothetical protein
MTQQRLRVLFLCTGNSARSQIAEAILRHLSHGRVNVASGRPQAQYNWPPGFDKRLQPRELTGRLGV